MNDFNEEAYNKYFGIEETKAEAQSIVPKDNVRLYPELERGNIGDIDTFAELLRTILNAAWGTSWGEFGPELKRGDNPNDILFPQITYDTYSREVSDKMPIKPVLTGTFREVIADKETGDTLQVYRQWFDVIIEFNIFAKDTRDLRDISHNFEALISTYTGYFKKKGISEMFFLKEVSSRQSDHFIEGIPMKALLYYFKLERIHTIRVSTLEKIDYALQSLENSVTNTTTPLDDKITYNL